MKIKNLTIEEVEYTGHALAKELFKEHSKNEPIPPFSTRYLGRLESCLYEPFQSFGGVSRYKFLYQRAAYMFYLCIKNHPFSNGNKRMAVMIVLLFFFKNKRWLNVPPHELYKVACSVAESPPSQKEIHQKALEGFFKHHQSWITQNRKK